MGSAPAVPRVDGEARPPRAPRPPLWTGPRCSRPTASASAYGAAGSDDGLDTEPRLKSTSVRQTLLQTLLTNSVHHSTAYRYSRGGYALEFNQAQGGLLAGLGRITGPWSTNGATSATTTTTTTTPTTASAGAGSSTSVSASRSSVSSSTCSTGTRPGGDGLYPCTDNATGAAVGPAGTFGVHGLKPCPPGTRTTNGISHNPKTGAVCATP